MKFFLFLLTCMASFQAFSQERFTQCAAAFLDDKMIVDTYSPTGKCTVSLAATGILRVYTVDLSSEKSTPLKSFPFRLAIRHQPANTLMMYSDAVYQQVDIASILKNCQPGDTLLLLTTSDQYALPHHEITVK